MEGLKPTYVCILQEHTVFAVFQACFQALCWEVVAACHLAEGAGLSCVDSTNPEVTQ